MGKIKVFSNVGEIDGLKIIIPSVLTDNRGYFTEVFNEEDLANIGIMNHFVQDNESYSHKNVLRGMHVNYNHPQAKLVRVLEGEIYDVAIDLRVGSSTYMKYYGVYLSKENRKQLFIPEGFGHGFLAITDARILFKVTTHYIPGDEVGFAWNSKEFNINWPVEFPILNENDKNSLDFSELQIKEI